MTLTYQNKDVSFFDTPYDELFPISQYRPGNIVPSLFHLKMDIVSIRVISFNIQQTPIGIIFNGITEDQSFYLESTIEIKDFVIENIFSMSESGGEHTILFYLCGRPLVITDHIRMIFEHFKSNYPLLYCRWLRGELMPMEIYERNFLKSEYSF